MPAQPRMYARLVWNFAYRFCSGARNSRKTGVLSGVILRSLLVLFFFATWTTAADCKPSPQADTPPANAHSSEARPSDDAKQPTTAGSDEAKLSSEKKNAPSPDTCTLNCDTPWTERISRGIIPNARSCIQELTIPLNSVSSPVSQWGTCTDSRSSVWAVIPIIPR